MKIWIPGIPRPKGRPRVCKRGTHTPKRTKAYEGVVAMHLNQCKPLDGPVAITLIFIMPRPKKPKYDWPAHSNCGDLDNLVKSIMDPGNGRLYHDDGQVCKIEAIKQYVSDADPSPGVWLWVEELE